MSEYSAEILESVRDVSPQEWDSTIATAVGIRHSVLMCFESAHPRAMGLRYVLLRDESKLQAVGVAVHVPSGDVGVAHMVLGRLAAELGRVVTPFCPALICGLLRGPGAPVVVRPGSSAKVWIPRVIKAMERYAAQCGLAVGFYSVWPEQTDLVTELRRRGYAYGHALPEASIRVTWRDQNEYLQMLRARSRNNHSGARSELSRFRRSGIVIESWDGTDEAALYGLLKRHHEKKNAVPFEMPEGFLSALRASLGGDLLVYTARKEAALVAVTVVLKCGTVAWLWKVGIDHAADGGNFTYFNINFYHLFREAPGYGLQRIWCGNGALLAKSRRGCDVALTGFFYKPRGSWSALLLRALLALQRAWYRRKFLPFLGKRNSARAEN